MRRLLTSAAVLVLAATGAGACGGDDDDDGAAENGFEVPTELTAAELVAAVGAVCDAVGQAPTDPVAAENTFVGRAHDGLHSIARQLEDVDRPAAASLLKAKERVESDFTEAAAADTIRTDLLALAGTAAAGVKLLDPTAAPPGCG